MLLAPYDGAPPPIAGWIKDALEITPERSFIEVNGKRIELLTWGDVGKPGLLFLHGAGAQADWWNVTAPFFAADYRVAAISWSGMGRSEWREDYSISHWVDEALAAIGAASLDVVGPPVVVAHSMGGSALMSLAANHPEKLTAGILVDSFIPRPRAPENMPGSKPLRRYEKPEEALVRYRLVPEQGTDFPEIVDYIARQSLRLSGEDEPGGAGWTWMFDPRVLSTMDLSGIASLPAKIERPMAIVTGERSAIMRAMSLSEMRAQFANCPIAISIPEAHHHIMLDQPLALIATLRTVLESL